MRYAKFPNSIYWFLILQLSLKYFPCYYLTASSKDPLYVDTIMIGVGKVRKFWYNVQIIKVKLMKLISEC